MFYFLFWVFAGLFCLNILTYCGTAVFGGLKMIYRPHIYAKLMEEKAKRAATRENKRMMKEELLAARCAENDKKGKKLSRVELEYKVKTLEGELEERTESYENELEERRQRFEAELALVVGHNHTFQSLLAAVSEAYREHEGRLGIYIFEGDGEEPIYEGDFDSLAEAIVGGRELTLRSALAELTESETRAVGEIKLAISRCELEGNEVYVLADISDSFRADDAERAVAELKQKIYEMDKLTTAMNFEAFVELQQAAEIDSTPNIYLGFTQVEPVLISDIIVEGFGEEYPKMCAEILVDIFGEGNVARYSSDSFCFAFTAKNEDEARAKLEEAISATEVRRRELWSVDDRLRGRNIWQLSAYDGSGLEDYIYSMSLRTRVDFQRGHSGLRIFEAEAVARVMGHRARFEETIKKKAVRFKYQPIAVAGTAKIFGYEMIPFFPKLPFETTEDMLHWANLFGLANRLEEMVQFELMRCYCKALDNALILGNMRILISTLPGACMVSKTEDDYYEKYYDLIPAVIAEITDHLPEDSRVTEIKCRHLTEWGMWGAVRCDEDIESNSMKMGVISPKLVRISAKVLSKKESIEDITKFIKFAHLHNALVMIDQITTAAQLEQAISVEADCVQGDFVGRASEEFAEISDKCIKKIGQLKFGKKRG